MASSSAAPHFDDDVSISGWSTISASRDDSLVVISHSRDDDGAPHFGTSSHHPVENVASFTVGVPPRSGVPPANASAGGPSTVAATGIAQTTVPGATNSNTATDGRRRPGAAAPFPIAQRPRANSRTRGGGATDHVSRSQVVPNAVPPAASSSSRSASTHHLPPPENRDDDDDDAAAPLREERKAIRKLIKGSTIQFEASNPRDVVLLSAVECGYRVIPRGSRDAEPDVVWIEAQPMSVAAVKELSPHQRVNFYPGMKLCATKCEFARVMGRMQRLFPGEFDFIPKTWSLPEDAAIFREHCAAEKAELAARSHPPAVYIVKPDEGCGGDGIYLTTDTQRISHPQCVVQEYLHRPLLLGGLKFDLRVYVLVTSIDPLRYFVCREGLARMAVDPYEAPSPQNMRNTNLHLTNYSLNKFSSRFIPNVAFNDDEASTKRSITTAFRQLADEYPKKGLDAVAAGSPHNFCHHHAPFDAEPIWDQIVDIAGKVLAAVSPIVTAVAGATTIHSAAAAAATASRASAASSAAAIPPPALDAAQGSYLPKCFHLLGFDVFIDDDQRCHLFEINNHPSLLTDAPVDFTVKSAVVKPLVRMVAYDTASSRRRRARLARQQLAAATSAPEGRSGGRNNRTAKASDSADDDDDNDNTDQTGSSPAERDRGEGLSLADRFAWEEAWCGEQYIAVTDAASRFQEYVEPFAALRDGFVILCGGSHNHGEMKNTKFVAFCRRAKERCGSRYGSVASFDVVDADLMFQRYTAQVSGRRYLAFHDFIDIVLGELGAKWCPHTPPCSLPRLRAMLDIVTLCCST